MKSFFFIIAILALASGCASSQQKREHWDGLCVSPFLNGGMPFELSPNAFYDGSTIGTLSSDGKSEALFTGAQCYLVRGTKDAASKK